MKLLFILFLSCVAVKGANVKVSLYYESLCPYCQNFITAQLVPTYNKLWNYIHLVLIPYGKANQTKSDDNKWEFNCQHGPDECFVNKVEACVLHLNKINLTLSDKVLFIYCLERSLELKLDLNSSIETCANMAKINPNSIKGCANSETGSNFLAAYGDTTHALNPPLKYVPDIRFNDVYDENWINDSLTDFKSVVCKFIGPVDECK